MQSKCIASGKAKQALLITVDGAFIGKAAIQRFFLDQFKNHPILNASIDHTCMEKDTVMVEWSAESAGECLPQAMDTYLIQ